MPIASAPNGIDRANIPSGRRMATTTAPSNPNASWTSGSTPAMARIAAIGMSGSVMRSGRSR